MSIPSAARATLAVSGGYLSGSTVFTASAATMRPYAARWDSTRTARSRSLHEPRTRSWASGNGHAYPPMTHDSNTRSVGVAIVAGPGHFGRAGHRHVFGYAVGLDMTRRDLQMNAPSRAGRGYMGRVLDEFRAVRALISRSLWVIWSEARSGSR